MISLSQLSRLRDKLSAKRMLMLQLRKLEMFWGMISKRRMTLHKVWMKKERVHENSWTPRTTFATATRLAAAVDRKVWAESNQQEDSWSAEMLSYLDKIRRLEASIDQTIQMSNQKLTIQELQKERKENHNHQDTLSIWIITQISPRKTIMGCLMKPLVSKMIQGIWFKVIIKRWDMMKVVKMDFLTRVTTSRERIAWGRSLQPPIERLLWEDPSIKLVAIIAPSSTLALKTHTMHSRDTLNQVRPQELTNTLIKD